MYDNTNTFMKTFSQLKKKKPHAWFMTSEEWLKKSFLFLFRLFLPLRKVVEVCCFLKPDVSMI